MPLRAVHKGVISRVVDIGSLLDCSTYLLFIVQLTSEYRNVIKSFAVNLDRKIKRHANKMKPSVLL